MAEENDAQEDDLEAEMLRMMQEELGGDEGDLATDQMLESMETDSGGENAGDALSSSAALPGAPVIAPPASDAEGIDRLTDVDVEISVELGENHVAIADIMSWAAGSIVDLLPEETEPVNLMLNGSPFARGEIVVVGDTFGVRIIELLDPSEEVV